MVNVDNRFTIACFTVYLFIALWSAIPLSKQHYQNLPPPQKRTNNDQILFCCLYFGEKWPASITTPHVPCIPDENFVELFTIKEVKPGGMLLNVVQYVPNEDTTCPTSAILRSTAAAECRWVQFPIGHLKVASWLIPHLLRYALNRVDMHLIVSIESLCEKNDENDKHDSVRSAARQWFSWFNVTYTCTNITNHVCKDHLTPFSTQTSHHSHPYYTYHPMTIPMALSVPSNRFPHKN